MHVDDNFYHAACIILLTEKGTYYGTDGKQPQELQSDLITRCAALKLVIIACTSYIDSYIAIVNTQKSL